MTDAPSILPPEPPPDSWLPHIPGESAAGARRCRQDDAKVWLSGESDQAGLYQFHPRQGGSRNPGPPRMRLGFERNYRISVNSNKGDHSIKYCQLS
jgi:hypothetical protein